MKKLVFSIFTFVICYSLQTQELELPNLSPQSPNAFQFTKYGEVNVNESTGTISPSIPLYSYNAGGFEIPIVLNYSGNAVKVAQSPTWVGINWNLTPGGVITRQVRDLPDEKIPEENKKFLSREKVNELAGYGRTNGRNTWHGIEGTDWYNEMEKIGSSTSSCDSEADVFNYNFLGYSGSFYLDEKLEPHLLNYNKELKIKFDRDLTPDSNKSTIYITTPQGDKYSFGGEDASESSRTYVSSSPESTVGIKHAQNAFYLYKVEPYKGGHIDFTYTQVYTGGSFHGHVVDEYENLKKRKNLISNCGTTHTYSGKLDILEEIQSRVMLTKISSNLNSGSVDFSSSSLDDRMRKLHTVFVKKADGSNIKKFTFNYFTDTAEEEHASDKKFFLEQVNFHDKNDTIIYDYDLEYNNPDRLPSKFSMAKDLNGYFNDVKMNTTLLPNNDQFKNTITLANRETNPKALQYGSLSKIIYPTGGYTNFIYESPIKGYITRAGKGILNVYHRAVDRNDKSYYKHVLYQGDDRPFYLEASQIINIKFSVKTEGDLTSKSYIRLYAVEGFNGPEKLINEFLIPGNGDDEEFNYDYDARFKVPTNNDKGYTFKLVLDVHSTLNDGDRISAFARIDIPNNTQFPDYFPSLRIKEISTYNPSSKDSNIKIFFYNRLRNRIAERSTLLANFNHVNTTTVGRSVEGDCTAGGPIPYLNLSTSALNNTYVDDSRKIIYPVVSVSYGGNNFEQGGKQSTFRVNVNQPNDLYFLEHENNELLLNVEAPYGNILSSDNGKLLNEKIVSYNDSTKIFKTLKETSYVYESRNVNTVHRINNIKASTVQSGATMAKDMRKYNFSFYQLISKKNLLTTRTTKEYLDNLSEPIITSESYQYGTYVDRPSETKITNSKGIMKKVKYFYPDDVEDTGSLGHDNLSSTELYAIERLKKDGLHRLNQVQTETHILNGSSDEILSTSRTLFNIDASTVVLPEIIQTSKGDNPLEDRVKYNYYVNGNIKSVSKIDGTKIYYVWGYELTQPIAKIENITSLTENQETYTRLTEEQQTAINKAVTASNSDDDRCILITEKCNENSLRDKLAIVRAAFPNSMVTTYTYDPLIGVTSITDPREETIYYHYDSFNRLEFVKDSDGNVLTENKYHYKE
jgi:hypothetical protein